MTLRWAGSAPRAARRQRPVGQFVAVSAVVGAVLVAILWPPSARASESPRSEIGFAEDTVNPPSLAGRVFMDAGLSGITRARLSTQSLVDGSETAALTVCDPCEPAPNSVPFDWATPALAYNGQYRLTVSAAGREALDLDGEQESTESRTYRLSLPAQAPASPTAVTEPDRKVTVSWARVTAHPDLVGYEVRRRAPNSPAFVVAGVVAQPPSATVSLSDSAPAASVVGGAYEYEIRSVRRGAYPEDANSAVFSTAVPARAIVPAGVAPTTSTSVGPTTTVRLGTGPATTLGSTTDPFLGQASAATTVTTAPRSPPRTLPDIFSLDLPFAGTTTTVETDVPELLEEEPEGRNTGTEEAGGGDDTNGRALLVPVAAGALLCVVALHLGWLSHRMSPARAAAPPPAAGGGRRSRRAGPGRGHPPSGPGPVVPVSHSIDYEDDLYAEDVYDPELYEEAAYVDEEALNTSGYDEGDDDQDDEGQYDDEDDDEDDDDEGQYDGDDYFGDDGGATAYDRAPGPVEGREYVWGEADDEEQLVVGAGPIGAGPARGRRTR